MSEGNTIRALDVMTPEAIAWYIQQKQTKEEFLTTENPNDRWRIIKRAYSRLTPLIMQRAEMGYLGMTNPYILDWCEYMTPIEYDAWCSIRYRGIGLFPQYPALNYFLDFANPYLKVAVEMDGAEFHSVERDTPRDEKLVADGWFIFRIPGRECYTNPPMLWEIESNIYLDQQERHLQLRQYFNTTSDGVFEAVMLAYFAKDGCRSPYFNYAMESLSRHRIVEFDVYAKVKGFHQ